MDRIGGGYIFSHKLSVCAQAVNAIDPSKRINFNINTKRFTIIYCSTFAPLFLGANLVQHCNPIV